MRGPLLAAAAVALVAIGVAAGALVWRDSGILDPGPGTRESTSAAGVPGPERGTPHLEPRIPGPGSRIPDPVVITLSPEMVTRAGIKTSVATRGAAATQLHLPGVIAPNAYKSVDVTSLVAGRITQVRAELGQRVVLGDVLATIYSPELADAQTAFIAAVAEHTAHDQRQARANRLFAIGAVSRQELEALEAQRADEDAKTETLRARLVLLGIPEERTQRLANRLDVVTTFDVKAPTAGVVVTRNANTGLNIDPSTPLFTVTDLSTVWVMADLYERDFAAVRVGSTATISTTAYLGLSLRGRVDYIDPRVQADTRTAKLRLEVPNADGRLRLGMFVDVIVSGASARPLVLVPKSALQAVGAASVVFVAGNAGRFTQRTVAVGDASGDQVAILEGLEPGDAVVSEGAFFLRAEAGRMAPDMPAADTAGSIELRATRP